MHLYACHNYLEFKDDRYSFAITSKHTDFFENLCVVGENPKLHKYEIKKWGHRPLKKDMLHFQHIPSSTMKTEYMESPLCFTSQNLWI